MSYKPDEPNKNITAPKGGTGSYGIPTCELIKDNIKDINTFELLKLAKENLSNVSIDNSKNQQEIDNLITYFEILERMDCSELAEKTKDKIIIKLNKLLGV